MPDWLWGDVSSVIDHSTFEFTLARQESDNDTVYAPSERVHIRTIDVAGVGEHPEQRSKEALEASILFEEVGLFVHGRDKLGRLDADVWMD